MGGAPIERGAEVGVFPFEPVEPVDLVRLTLERPDGTTLTLALPAASSALAERLIAALAALVA